MLKVQGYFKIPIKSYKFTSLIYYAHLFPEHFTVFLCPTIILLKFEDNSFIYTVDICDSNALLHLSWPLLSMSRNSEESSSKFQYNLKMIDLYV